MITGKGKPGGAIKIIKNSEGYLQIDGYNACYIFDEQKQITRIHCMDNAERMFNDAFDNDKSRAKYAIGRRCSQQGLAKALIKDTRNKEAIPVLKALAKWM